MDINSDIEIVRIFEIIIVIIRNILSSLPYCCTQAGGFADIQQCYCIRPAVKIIQRCVPADIQSLQFVGRTVQSPQICISADIQSLQFIGRTVQTGDPRKILDPFQRSNIPPGTVNRNDRFDLRTAEPIIIVCIERLNDAAETGIREIRTVDLSYYYCGRSDRL